jgi:hypothetical protein
VGDILQENGLTGPGRGDDQAALPLADGGKHIHDPGGEILRIPFQFELLLGVKRRQVVEEDFVPSRFGAFEVDGIDLEEGEILFPFLGRSDLTGNGIPGPEAEATDLGR